MNLDRCFEILELHPNATMEEASRAYKDLVSVWHPDRFQSNPRLRRKAERKLKELNRAYETLESYFSRRHEDVKKERDREHSKEESQGISNTEAAFEVGTHLFLSACSYVYRALKGALDKKGGP